MKKYRPQTKTIVAGLVLMILGVLCWCLLAPFKRQAGMAFLLPLGLLLVCSGGLELTITAFITLRKNDLTMRQSLQKKEKNKSKK